MSSGEVHYFIVERRNRRQKERDRGFRKRVRDREEGKDKERESLLMPPRLLYSRGCIEDMNFSYVKSLRQQQQQPLLYTLGLKIVLFV